MTGGLTPVTVDLGKHNQPCGDPSTSPVFGIADRTASLTVIVGAHSLEIECEPNHLEVCHVSGGEASEWSVCP